MTVDRQGQGSPAKGTAKTSTQRSELRAVWTDKRMAAERILNRFGLDSALEYLVDKFSHFVWLAQQHPEHEADLPAFAKDVQSMFPGQEIRKYLYRRRPRHVFGSRQRLLRIRQLLGQ